MKVLLQMYNRALHSRPILIQTVQTSILMGTGDVISQIFIEKKPFEEYSILRTLQFSSIGFCFLVSTLTQLIINNSNVIELCFKF